MDLALGKTINSECLILSRFYLARCIWANHHLATVTYITNHVLNQALLPIFPEDKYLAVHMFRIIQPFCVAHIKSVSFLKVIEPWLNGDKNLYYLYWEWVVMKTCNFMANIHTGHLICTSHIWTEMLSFWRNFRRWLHACFEKCHFDNLRCTASDENFVEIYDIAVSVHRRTKNLRRVT